MTKGVGGSIKTAGAPEENALLKCVGTEIDGIIIFADLFDKLYRESKGQVPAELVVVCPRCNQPLRVNGEAKEISVEYLERPRKVTLSDGKVVNWTKIVTVNKPLTCTRPAWSGKASCGLTFKITDGYVHRL